MSVATLGKLTLPSQDIARDVAWYIEHTGFKPVFYDNMYGVLQRDSLEIHLQWHADTPDDPLLGGSVIRIQVEDLKSWFEEFLKKGTIKEEALRLNTPWGTNEFGFYDLNKNAIFMMEDV